MNLKENYALTNNFLKEKKVNRSDFTVHCVYRIHVWIVERRNLCLCVSR